MNIHSFIWCYMIYIVYMIYTIYIVHLVYISNPHSHFHELEGE